MKFPRTPLLAFAGAALAATAFAPAPASAPDDGSTEVSVSGTTVTVSGDFAEDLGPIVIGTDPGDDAVTSGSGMDATEYAVSFPRAGTVAFHVEISDPNPATGYFPQGTTFEIAPTIGDESIELTATATLDGEAVNGGLDYGAQTCEVNPDTGVNECSSTPVEGSYEDGVVTWFYDTGLTANQSINGGHVHVNYHVGTAATGGVTFVNGIIDEMGINDFAAIPSATLLVDGAEAGVAAASSAGYSVSAVGVESGERALGLRLCGGDADFTQVPEDCTTVDLGTVTVG